MWTDDGPTTWCPPYKAWVTRPVDMMTHAEEQREKIKQSHTQVPVSLFAISWHTKLVVLVSASPPPSPRDIRSRLVRNIGSFPGKQQMFPGLAQLISN